MSNSNPRTPLTLEDLLRLKKAERPSSEFWTRFERDLRQKQLAALLERRPWWQTLPLRFSRSRVLLPLGATAIIALVFGMSRFDIITRRALVGAEVSPIQIGSSGLEPSSVVVAQAVGLDEPQAAVTLVEVADTETYRASVAASVVPLSEHLPEHAVELTPWSARSPEQTISARMAAANSTPLTRVALELPQPLAGNAMLIASDRLRRSGGAVAELASVSALASKRTRLLAQFSERQFAPEPQVPASVRERLTRHLSDTSFTEHFTRIGLKGDQVSLRF